MPNFALNKISYLVYGLLLASVTALIYLWNSTNPTTIAPMGILLIFVLLYLFWLSVFFVILHLSFVLLKKTALLKFLISRRQGRPFKERVAYYVASILAFAPVLILAMQSVNQLTLRDVALVFLFVSLAIFYVVKRI